MKSIIRFFTVFLLLLPLSFATACSVKETDTPADSLFSLNAWFYICSSPNNRIYFLPEQDYTFRVAVESGEILDPTGNEYVKYAEFSPGEWTRWQNNPEDIEQDYIKIKIMAQDKFAGYTVIRVYEWEPLEYSATVLKCVLFDDTDEKIDDLNDEKVDRLIEKAKK